MDRIPKALDKPGLQAGSMTAAWPTAHHHSLLPRAFTADWQHCAATLAVPLAAPAHMEPCPPPPGCQHCLACLPCSLTYELCDRTR